MLGWCSDSRVDKQKMDRWLLQSQLKPPRLFICFLLFTFSLLCILFCFITSLSLFTLFFLFPLLFLFILHINVLLFLHLIPLSFVFGVSIIPASTFIYLACLHVFFSLLYFLPHLSFPIFHLFLLFELFFFPSSFFCILINVFLPSISASSVSSSPLPLSSLHFLHLFFFPIFGLSGSFFSLFSWFCSLCLGFCSRLPVVVSAGGTLSGYYKHTSNSTHTFTLHLSFPAGCKNRKPIKSDSFMSEH